MSVTLLTSQDEISPLNEESSNKKAKYITMHNNQKDITPKKKKTNFPQRIDEHYSNHLIVLNLSLIHI